MDMMAVGADNAAMAEVVAARESAGPSENSVLVRLERWLPWVVWAIAFGLLSTLTTGLGHQPETDVARVVGLIVGTMAVTTIGALVVSRGQARPPGWLLVEFGLLWSIGLAAYNLVEPRGV